MSRVKAPRRKTRTDEQRDQNHIQSTERHRFTQTAFNSTANFCDPLRFLWITTFFDIPFAPSRLCARSEFHLRKLRASSIVRKELLIDAGTPLFHVVRQQRLAQLTARELIVVPTGGQFAMPSAVEPDVVHLLPRQPAAALFD